MLLITMQATCRPRLGWGGGVVQPLPLSHAAEFGTPPSRRPIFMRLGSGLQSKRPELRIRTASAKSPADSSHLTAGRHPERLVTSEYKASIKLFPVPGNTILFGCV